MRRLLLPVLLLVAACSEQRSDGPLQQSDLDQVRGVIASYAEGWEADDSAAVLALFTDDAGISPSGLTPREGKSEIRAFWFPDDSSTVDVLLYDIEVLDAGGSGDMAYTYERGDLSFTYTRGTTSLSKKTRSYATTLYRRTPEGWKIFRRMSSKQRSMAQFSNWAEEKPL